MDILRVISLNAKGLNVPEKRQMFLQDMHRLKADIVLVQETHFRDDKLPILRNKFFPTTYHSTYLVAKVRGVSILLSAWVPWTHLDIMTDPEGRFLFLKGMIGSVKVTLENFYIPNSQQDLLLCGHLENFLEFAEGQLIIGGDFNIPLIPAEDTSSGTSSVPPGTRKSIAKSLYDAQLVDVWRLFHPGDKDYIFYSPPHKVYSRIDYFLIPHT